MGKAKILIESKVILKGQVLTIRLVDISLSDVDTQKLRIDILDRNNTPIEEEEKVIELTEEYLVMWRQSQEDLYNYLIQFRNSVPADIYSETRHLFVYPDWTPKEKMFRVGELIKEYFIAGISDEPLYADYIRNSVEIEYDEILSILRKYEGNGVLVSYADSLDSFIGAENGQINIIKLLNSLKPIHYEDEKGISVHPEPASALVSAGGAQVVTSDHCNETMFDGNPCKQEPCSNGKCICHSDEPDKDVDKFREVVDGMLRSAEDSDFSGFVFPEKYRFPKDREFKGKLRFHQVTFHNYVNLSDKTFHDSIVFRKCHFQARATFEEAFFKSDMEFRFCIMERCSFDHARFGDRVIFENNYKREHVPSSMVFNGAMFDNPQQVLFKDIFLPQMTFSGCNVATINILNLKSLSDSNYDCHVLGDQVELEREKGTTEDATLKRDDYKNVIECYQRLQRNMLSAKNNSSAGKFHVRELELERTMRSGYDRLPFSLYKWLAYYGERIWQPILILLFVFLSIPIFTMFVMGDLNYDWTWQFPDILTALEVWWRDFVSNLRCIFYMDNDVFSHRVIPTETNPKADISPSWHFLFVFEKLFSIVMLSFVVVAFRRRFRRY